MNHIAEIQCNLDLVTIRYSVVKDFFSINMVREGQVDKVNQPPTHKNSGNKIKFHVLGYMDLKKKQNIMYPGTVNFDFCINCNVEKLSKRDKNTQESAVTEVFESFLKSQSAPCKNCLNSCFERTKLKHLLSKSSYKSSAVRFVCSRVVQLYYKLARRFKPVFAVFPVDPVTPSTCGDVSWCAG